MVTRKTKDAILQDASAHQVQRWLLAQRDCDKPNALFTISRAIELLYGKPEPHEFDTERGLVEYVIRFTNGHTDRSESRNYLKAPDKIRNETGWVINPMHAILAKQENGWPSQSIAKWQEADSNQEFHNRIYFTRLFAATITDAASAADQFLPAGPSLPYGVWALPVFKRERSGAALQAHFIITEPSAFEIFVALLLLDASRMIGEELNRCMLEGCDNFFLTYKPRTGRPQKLYCKREHMQTAHSLTATSRARKSRANKQKGKKK